MGKERLLLMICSWLDFDKMVGACFWEQAKFSQIDFEVVLCHFKRKDYTLRDFITSRKKYEIEIAKSPNELRAFFINYPYCSFFPESVNVSFHKKAVRLFYEYLNKQAIKISLVHAQSIYNAGFEALYFKYLSKAPYIITEHNQFTLRERTTYETRLTSKVLSYAKKRLVVSYDKIRQFASNWYYHDFEVVGNAVDDQLFYYSNDYNAGDNRTFNLVTNGAYVPIKDQKTMLKALKHIDSEVLNVNFSWIGHGSWGKNNEVKLRELIESFDFRNIKIELFPLLSRQEVATTLQKSDLFLFSSLSEGMPISVLEALSVGVPVCTTNCGGVDEIINDTNGKIVKIKDHRAMANFTLALYRKEIRFDNEEISKRIIESYGSKPFGKKLNSIYLESIT